MGISGEGSVKCQQTCGSTHTRLSWLPCPLCCPSKRESSLCIGHQSSSLFASRSKAVKWPAGSALKLLSEESRATQPHVECVLRTRLVKRQEIERNNMKGFSILKTASPQHALQQGWTLALRPRPAARGQGSRGRRISVLPPSLLLV
jgi:hypothetical protein